jgi:hypothetical protein
MTVLLGSCVRGYEVKVTNPCTHPIEVVLTDAWESWAVRDAMTSGDYGNWTNDKASLAPVARGFVGHVDDAAGFEKGWTVWVDGARFRLDFNVDQLQQAEYLIQLPEAACREVSDDAEMAEAFLDTPVPRYPIAEWAHRSGDGPSTSG